MLRFYINVMKLHGQSHASLLTSRLSEKWTIGRGTNKRQINKKSGEIFVDIVISLFLLGLRSHRNTLIGSFAIDCSFTPFSLHTS